MNIEIVQNVFRTVFDIPELVIKPETTAKDVEAWDSFNHINLIVALEDEFAITFTTDEIAGMANVGDLVEILKSKGITIDWI